MSLPRSPRPLARGPLAAVALLVLVLAGPPAAAADGPPVPQPAERPDGLERLLRELAAPGGPPAAPSTPSAALATPTAAASFDLAPELATALADYRSGGEPAVLGTPTARVWPFGHGVPTLTCLPLRACDVVLEAGETLLGWALGDSERWRAEELVEGTPPSQRPHLLLKPTATGLTTNLVLVTDHRTYHLELISPELGDDEEPLPYDHRVSWWYPDDWVRRLDRADALQAAEAARAASRHTGAVELDRPLDPDRLSFAYRVERSFWPGRRLPWQPLTVFDDGERVYLRLPDAARRHELPVLLGRLPDGSTYPLATRLAGEWLIVPALFDRAELVLGTGDRRRSLTLVHTAETAR